MSTQLMFRSEPVRPIEWRYYLEEVASGVCPLMHDRTFPVLGDLPVNYTGFNHKQVRGATEVVATEELAERGLDLQGIFGISHIGGRKFEDYVSGQHPLWGLTRGGGWIKGELTLLVQDRETFPHYACTRVVVEPATVDEMIERHDPARVLEKIQESLDAISNEISSLLEKIGRVRDPISEFVHTYRAFRRFSASEQRIEANFPRISYKQNLQSRPLYDVDECTIRAEVFLRQGEAICPFCSRTYFPMERFKEKCYTCQQLPPDPPFRG